MDNFDGDLGKRGKKNPTGHRVSVFTPTARFIDAVCRFLFALLLVVRTGDQRRVQP